MDSDTDFANKEFAALTLLTYNLSFLRVRGVPKISLTLLGVLTEPMNMETCNKLSGALS